MKEVSENPATKEFWLLACDNEGCSGAEIFGKTESKAIAVEATCPSCGIAASPRHISYCPLDLKKRQQEECPCFDRGISGWCRWNPEGTDRCDYSVLGIAAKRAAEEKVKLAEATLGMGLTATAYRDLLKKHNTEKARADAAEAKLVEVKKERDSHWASRNEYVDHANTWRERYEKEKEKHERRTTMPKRMNKNDKSEFTVEEAIDRLIGAMEAEERSGVKLKIIPKLNAVLDACLDLITATRRMVSGKGE